ncbi:MAG: sensor histidine kinase [Clostridia bacterium]|nr:sensor histidine kinase [Clostridia bacterium]
MPGFFIQLLIPFALVFFRFPKKKYFRIVAPIAILSFLVGVYFLEKAIMLLPKPWSFYVYYLVCYCAILGAGLLFFDLSVFKTLYFCVFAFVVQNFAHHVCQFFLQIVKALTEINFESTFWGSFLSYLIAYTVVYTIVYFAFLHDRRFEKITDVSSLPVLLLGSAFMLVLIVLGIYIKHMQAELLEVNAIAIGYETYSVILDVFLVGLFIGIFHTTKLEGDAHELERRLEQESKYYEMAQANMELINIKCHDLKHQISALQSMEDNEERKAEIEELQSAVMIYDSYAKTGNDALDCVLTEKSLYCNNRGVRFTYMADGSGLQKMRYMDIYALFGNAIDNAIENVLKIADETKRIISLRVFEKGGWLNIHLENYCEDKPVLQGELPVTTKPDKRNHGYGLKSIRYIAHKYGGSFHVKVSDRTFCLSVLIPV